MKALAQGKGLANVFRMVLRNGEQMGKQNKPSEAVK